MPAWAAGAWAPGAWAGTSWADMGGSGGSGPPHILTTSLDRGLIRRAYSVSIQATGVLPISWGVASGVLPPGLTLDPMTGLLSGFPTKRGTFRFSVQALNAEGTDIQELSVDIISVGQGGKPPKQYFIDILTGEFP